MLNPFDERKPAMVLTEIHDRTILLEAKTTQDLKPSVVKRLRFLIL